MSARSQNTPMDGSQALQQLASGKLFSHGWPVAIGSAASFLVTEATVWTHPAVVAVLTGALVQVFIALMRNWFTERRELLTTLRDMLQEQRRYVHDMLREDQQHRHQLVNRAADAEMKLHLLSHGVPWDDLPNMPPLYDGPGEQAHESGAPQPPSSANR